MAGKPGRGWEAWSWLGSLVVAGKPGRGWEAWSRLGSLVAATKPLLRLFYRIDREIVLRLKTVAAGKPGRG